MNSSQLENQARRAYELGRLAAASQWLLPVVPVVCLALYTCSSVGLVLGLGAFLGALVVALKWRGQDFGFAVGPGLWAGSVAFLIPFTLEALDLCCRFNLERVICSGSGAVGGFLVGRAIARSSRKNKWLALGVAIAIASTTALLGCLAFDLGSLAGLAFALILVGVSTFRMKAEAPENN